MKTAMMELIEKIEKSYELADGDTEWQKGYRNGMTYIKLLSTELLEKEKEQIKNAYKEGGDEYQRMADVHNKKSWFLELTFDEPTHPDDYYNQTYNS